MRWMYHHKFTYFCGQEHSYNLGRTIHGHQIKMTEYIKEPHTAMFIGQTNCGKIHLVLELTENHYNNHFDYIVIIYPTLRENSTYHAKEWIKTYDNVWLVEPTKDKLYQWIKKLSQLLAHSETLFIIDDTLLMKALITGDNPYSNCPSRVDTNTTAFGY